MPNTGKRSQPNRKLLSKTVVDAANAAEKWDRMVWDTKITGFGLQVKPSGHKAYVYQYRNRSGRVRRLILGAHGKLTAVQARKRAREVAGDVEKGRDLVEEEPPR